MIVSALAVLFLHSSHLLLSVSAEELNAADVPAACSVICQPIVQLTAICDIDPGKVENDSDNNKGMSNMMEADEPIEAQCVCTNKSFNVQLIAANCASCLKQNRAATDGQLFNGVPFRKSLFGFLFSLASRIIINPLADSDNRYGQHHVGLRISDRVVRAYRHAPRRRCYSRRVEAPGCSDHTGRAYTGGTDSVCTKDKCGPNCVLEHWRDAGAGGRSSSVLVAGRIYLKTLMVHATGLIVKCTSKLNGSVFECKSCVSQQSIRVVALQL